MHQIEEIKRHHMKAIYSVYGIYVCLPFYIWYEYLVGYKFSIGK